MYYIVVINKDDNVSVKVFTDEIKAKACFWHNVAINMERIKAYCFSRNMEYDFSKQEPPIKYNLMDDAYNLGFILLTDNKVM